MSERSKSRAGIVEKSYSTNEFIVMRGDHFEHLTGVGALSGISRQNANQCLKRLEKEGLLRLEYGVTIVDLERLGHFGE